MKKFAAPLFAVVAMLFGAVAASAQSPAAVICRCGCEPDKYGQCPCEKCKEKTTAAATPYILPRCYHDGSVCLCWCSKCQDSRANFVKSQAPPVKAYDPYGHDSYKNFLTSIEIGIGRGKLAVGVPDPWVSSYENHCRVASGALGKGIPDGLYECYRDKKIGKAMMKPYRQKVLAPIPKNIPRDPVTERRLELAALFLTEKLPLPGHIMPGELPNGDWHCGARDATLWEIADDAFLGPIVIELCRVRGVLIDFSGYKQVYGTTCVWAWTGEARYWLLWDINQKCRRPIDGR